MQRISLEEWDQQVGHHLHKIDHCAEIIDRHATQLLGLPDWETRAMDQLAAAELALKLALARLAAARKTMEGKPHVS